MLPKGEAMARLPLINQMLSKGKYRGVSAVSSLDGNGGATGWAGKYQVERGREVSTDCPGTTE